MSTYSVIGKGQAKRMDRAKATREAEAAEYMRPTVRMEAVKLSALQDACRDADRRATREIAAVRP